MGRPQRQIDPEYEKYFWWKKIVNIITKASDGAGKSEGQKNGWVIKLIRMLFISFFFNFFFILWRFEIILEEECWEIEVFFIRQDKLVCPVFLFVSAVHYACDPSNSCAFYWLLTIS